MEISDLAERLLFARTIDEKLIAPDELTDASPVGQARRPRWPGRPSALRLDGPKRRIPFPRLDAATDEHTRGLVLHFFANHELLAIELMALFLLRFPDALSGLRRSVAHTIVEEQTHVRLYVTRMAELGVVLGEAPVSSFFWDCLADMRDPKDYLAGMSLTLEQANLDYCAHYIERFTAIGDVSTAELLKTVRADEIGHVGVGVRWFERLADKDDVRGLWARYEDSLRPPLTPAWAKGIGYDRGARRAAGLDDAFIDRLELFNRSKSRLPDVYWFNPSCEAYFAAGQRRFKPTKDLLRLTDDLSTLPMFLCGADDMVLLSRLPRAGFLRPLKAAGFVIPDFSADPITDLADRKLGRLRPWAWSPDAALHLGPLEGSARRPPEHRPDRVAFEKSWSAERLGRWLNECDLPWLCDAADVGRVARSYDEATSQIDALRRAARPVVIKAPLGTAGRGMLRELADADRARNARWIQRIIDRQGAVIVEPWLDGRVNLSAHIDIRPDGAVVHRGISRFVTDRRGWYLASIVGDPMRGLSRPLVRFIAGPGGGRWRAFDHLEGVARFVGEALAARGHRGPVGLDALVYLAADGEFRLKPIVEVNPRFTMGRISLALNKRLAPGRCGYFMIVGADVAANAGFSTLADLGRSLEAVPTHLDDAGRLTAAALCLTDAGHAGRSAAWLMVGQSLDASVACLPEALRPTKFEPLTRAS